MLETKIAGTFTRKRVCEWCELGARFTDCHLSLMSLWGEVKKRGFPKCHLHVVNLPAVKGRSWSPLLEPAVSVQPLLVVSPGCWMFCREFLTSALILAFPSGTVKQLAENFEYWFLLCANWNLQKKRLKCSWHQTVSEMLISKPPFQLEARGGKTVHLKQR